MRAEHNILSMWANYISITNRSWWSQFETSSNVSSWSYFHASRMDVIFFPLVFFLEDLEVIFFAQQIISQLLKYIVNDVASTTTGHLTARSDVYSFGVVLLELLTGRKSVDKTRPGREQSLVDWARPKLTDKRKLLQIIDPRLEGQYSVRAAHKACSLAYYCLSQNPKARPLMSDVVETLEPLQVSSNSGEASASHSLLPDYRMHRRMTESVSVGCRAIPDPKCSPSATVCRVRWSLLTYMYLLYTSNLALVAWVTGFLHLLFFLFAFLM